MPDGATTMSLTWPPVTRRQVGVLDELAGLLLAQDLAVAHRHDEHPPVGQPPEPGRLLRHADDLLRHRGPGTTDITRYV